MEHYLIIRVTEEDTKGNTKAGFLRRMIHRLAMENDIHVTDNLVREDREFLPNGEPIPYWEVRELFRKISKQKEV